MQSDLYNFTTVDMLDKFTPISYDIEQQAILLAKSNNAMMQEYRLTHKRRNPVEDLEDVKNDFEQFANTLEGKNFLRVVYEVVEQINIGYVSFIDQVESLIPGELVLSNHGYGDGPPENTEELQGMIYEQQLNEGVVNRWVSSVLSIREAKYAILTLADNICNLLDRYYQVLMNRHSVDGVEIQRDPIVTDIAISIYENIDSHGEIESGKESNEISAYSLHKAEIIASAMKSGPIAKFIKKPISFLSWVEENLLLLWDGVDLLNHKYEKLIKDVEGALAVKSKTNPKQSELSEIIFHIKDLDPRTVPFKEKSVMLSSEERFNISFRNETLKKIVSLLVDENKKPVDIVQYILGRKSELRKFFQDENSFYVCKIGAGNAFGGKAPGALEVIPGSRPNINIKDILGSGFDEVREFIGHVESSDKWADLFMATSPSKTTDKSNVLLVGPVGCLADTTFIQFEVRGESGERINHKGGTIETLYRRFNKLKQITGGPEQRMDVYFTAPSFNDEGEIIQNRVMGVIATGEKECFELITAGGEKIIATADHKFFDGISYTQLSDLKLNDIIFVHRNILLSEGRSPRSKRISINVKYHPVAGIKMVGKYKYHRLTRSRAIVEANINNLEFKTYINRLNENNLVGLKFLPRELHVHHKDENTLNYSLDNLIVIDGVEHNREHSKEHHNQIRYSIIEDQIIQIKSIGIKKTYDVQMAGPYNNVIADGIAVHNCGKSEVLRGVASDKKSIGVFAQGSDFMTCWAGEAQKNPKRLFEAGLKLQKEAKKHVHFLIDEIDAVLNNDKTLSNFNLTLEFQILMDGVVNYPHLSVWGATNNPERIPIAMLRRFSKVIICGELNQNDRKTLLTKFTNYMPIKKFKEEDWGILANRLEGATGDVLRKVIDFVWRSKMSKFVQNHPEQAEKLINLLNQGEKFQIVNFNNDQREIFKKELSQYMAVEPNDIDESITIHLDNIAIRHEIQTAVDTYSKAKKYLSGINLDNIG